MRDFLTLKLETQIQVKEHRVYCCTAFHSHSRVFNNEQNSYLKMSVKWLVCSWMVLFNEYEYDRLDIATCSLLTTILLNAIINIKFRFWILSSTLYNGCIWPDLRCHLFVNFSQFTTKNWISFSEILCYTWSWYYSWDCKC